MINKNKFFIKKIENVVFLGESKKIDELIKINPNLLFQQTNTPIIPVIQITNSITVLLIIKFLEINDIIYRM